MNSVYEPAEDSWLLADCIVHDKAMILELKPALIAEIGSGSGFVMSQVATMFRADEKPAMICVDINAEACIATAQKGDFEVCQGTFLQNFVNNPVFDLVLFNPPYVPTSEEEMTKGQSGGVEAAWAGGENGCEVTYQFMDTIPSRLAKYGLIYLVLEKRNNIARVLEIAKEKGLCGEEVGRKRAMNETLLVYRFKPSDRDPSNERVDM